MLGLALLSLAAAAQEWPYCIDGCTANDVELIEVTADVSGPPAPDGTAEVTLWGSLYFNRNNSYCVRLVADVYVDGTRVLAGLVSEPFNVDAKGAYPAAYLGTVSLPRGAVLRLENVRIMWSVDNSLDPASKCQGCEDYGPGSKCTGDQFGSIVVPLPLDAADDAAETDEDTPVTTDVLRNDALGAVPTSVTGVTNGRNGTTQRNPDGTVTYSPNPGFFGTDDYTYTIEDSRGETDSATVSVVVLAVNDPPVARDDAAVTDENEFVAIVVIANDTDSDGEIDRTTVSIAGDPSRGTVDVDPGTGTVTYRPDPGTCGIDEFSYTIRDVDGAVSNRADVTVDVRCNAPPVARDDVATTDENCSIGINVVANDGDSDGFVDAATIVIERSPGSGSLNVHPSTGVITYTPRPGSCGVDSFRYTVKDDDGSTSNEATVEVDVLCNDPPVAIDDLYRVAEGETLFVPDPGVLSNDVTTPDEPLNARLVRDVLHGALTLHADGSFTYFHDGSETTSDLFTYLANDGTDDSNVATVSLVIAPSNDPPSANDDEERTDEDVPVTIDVLANDEDPDGDRLSVDRLSRPSNGTATRNGDHVTYTPDPNFFGVDTFMYVVSDGCGGTDEAAVLITVAARNDPPIAQDDSAATREETPVTIRVLANDSDPDADALLVESVARPAHGSVERNGSDVTYTPAPDFSGVDTFVYTISDGRGGTASAVVTVAVSAVNDPPTARDDSAATDEGTPLALGVLANDSDPDGDPLGIESFDRPPHGAAVRSGTSLIYTPAPGFSGVDTFRYTITDGRGGTSTATVRVTVVATNDPPAAQDDSHATNEDTPVTIPVLLNDSDPEDDPLVVESVTQPAHGAVTNGGTDLRYVPDAGFAGIDSFTYTVSDGRGGKDRATVTVVVHAVNDPPIAQDDSASTAKDTLVTIPILSNDSDPDGDFLLVVSLGQPRNGSVLNTRRGASYIPNLGFEGIDTFSYIVSDGNGGTDAATVTVSVARGNEAPVPQDDNGSTDEGVAVTLPILLNDRDPDGDPLTIESVAAPEHGSVVSSGIDVAYTPDPGFSGLDTFTYTVSDGNGATARATVFVAVAPVNDAPVAQDDSQTTDQDASVTIAVLTNDADPDGDPLAIVSVSQPRSGTVVRVGRELVYTPDPDFTGTDSFTYTVSDSDGLTDTATVTIGVASVAGRGGAAGESGCDGKVVINEIAWAGTVSDPRDEWIELRNLGTTPVRLEGWVLQWRRSHPSTPEEYVYRTVELSGVLQPASAAACERTGATTGGRVVRENPADIEWLVVARTDPADGGYYVLERRHDKTISDRKADLVYDTASALRLDLSDHGEVVMLVNDRGEVVDTANASNLGRNGWAAGSATTFGTMERIDPLGPDVASNWRTNTGIVIRGKDAKGRPLRATAGGANSPGLEELEGYGDIVLTPVRPSDVIRVDMSLPRQDRKTAGWPWIGISRPGLAGSGGDAGETGYSFSGRYEGGDRYVLEIATRDLPPGSYVFSLVYGDGKAMLVPILVTR